MTEIHERLATVDCSIKDVSDKMQKIQEEMFSIDGVSSIESLLRKEAKEIANDIMNHQWGPEVGGLPPSPTSSSLASFSFSDSRLKKIEKKPVEKIEKIVKKKLETTETFVTTTKAAPPRPKTLEKEDDKSVPEAATVPTSTAIQPTQVQKPDDSDQNRLSSALLAKQNNLTNTDSFVKKLEEMPAPEEWLKTKSSVEQKDKEKKELEIKMKEMEAYIKKLENDREETTTRFRKTQGTKNETITVSLDSELSPAKKPLDKLLNKGLVWLAGFGTKHCILPPSIKKLVINEDDSESIMQ